MKTSNFNFINLSEIFGKKKQPEPRTPWEKFNRKCDDTVKGVGQDLKDGNVGKYVVGAAIAIGVNNAIVKWTTIYHLNNNGGPIKVLCRKIANRGNNNGNNNNPPAPPVPPQNNQQNNQNPPQNPPQNPDNQQNADQGQGQN